jgi:hypothetical protein
MHAADGARGTGNSAGARELRGGWRGRPRLANVVLVHEQLQDPWVSKLLLVSQVVVDSDSLCAARFTTTENGTAVPRAEGSAGVSAGAHNGVGMIPGKALLCAWADRLWSAAITAAGFRTAYLSLQDVGARVWTRIAAY